MFGAHVETNTASKAHHRKLALAGLFAFAASFVAFGLGFGPVGAVLAVLSFTLMVGALVLFVISGLVDVVRSLRSWRLGWLLSFLIALTAAAFSVAASRFIGGVLLCAIGAATFLREASDADNRSPVSTLVIFAGVVAMLVGGVERALFAAGQGGALLAAPPQRLAYLFAGLAPLLLLAARSFNQLVQLERAKYAEEWESDGRPSGFRRATTVDVRLSNAWLKSTPQWMKADTEALRLVHRLRLCALLWTLGFAAGAILCMTV